jgi:Tfp pilus assembly protein PilO
LLVLAPQEKLRAQTEKLYVEAKRTADAAKEAAKEETQNKLLEQADNWDKRLQNFVTGEENTANLTFDISQISSGIELKSFGITPTGSEGIIEIENCEYIFAKHIQVSFSGSFIQFASFLNALERWQPVIFVDTFGITRSSGSSSDHSVDMRLAVLIGKDVETKKGVDS